MAGVALNGNLRPALNATRLAALTLVFPFSVSLAAGTLASFASSVFLLLFATLWLLLPWLACMIVAACAATLRRLWWNAAFLFAAAVAAAPMVLWTVRGGDYIHLVIMLPSYMQQTSATELTSFDWGCSGIVVSGSCDTLMHDPTDRIRTEKITSRSRGGHGLRGDPERASVRHLLGHYYLVYALI